MDAGELAATLEGVPAEPGVYQFFERDTALYVGKAVDLRSRVASYRDPRSPRIRAMLARADRLEYALTDTETQALLLEANLIKRLQPRYNVRLTDDKSFPLVQLTDHEFPRIEVTRDPAVNATVFGPFTDRQRLDAVVKAIRERHGLRGCSDHKFAGRDRPCLDHEIGLCDAPCVGEVDAETYARGVEAAARYFAGEVGVLAGPLEAEMAAAAEDRAYERAANLRDRLRAARQLHGSGEPAIAGSAGPPNLDVVGVAMRGDEAVVARLHSKGGQLVDRTRVTMAAPDVGDDRVAEVVGAFLTQYYAERSLPDAVVVQELPEAEVRRWLEGEGVEVRVAGAGRDATLLDLALKNAATAPSERGDPTTLVGERLGIDPPRRIEGLDVSHAQGRAVVGANVCLVDGRPEKSAYRRKRLPEGNDDVDRMGRLARWRVDRAVENRDDRPDPDLVLVDGGTAQLDAVRDAFGARDWSVPVVALAKREETVVTPDGPADWRADDPALHLLQRVRDEAHRFAVSYHQSVRDQVGTVLDDVPGIGPTRRRRLLRRFGSLEGVRAASEAELRDVEGIGEETARALAARL
ncbi:MAG: excinuclease ABC subunit C [Halobacteriales archaeon]